MAHRSSRKLKCKLKRLELTPEQFEWVRFFLENIPHIWEIFRMILDWLNIC
jgi:hypothetical protein